jgi:hypothetical protein
MDINIIDIVKDIEESNLTVPEILVKHQITIHTYNKICKSGNLKKKYANVKKEKNTKFKQLLQDCSTDSFDLEKFKEDCKAGIKLSELMEKYGLSLYQVRELRKKYDLKTK